MGTYFISELSFPPTLLNFTENFNHVVNVQLQFVPVGRFVTEQHFAFPRVF